MNEGKYQPVKSVVYPVAFIFVGVERSTLIRRVDWTDCIHFVFVVVNVQTPAAAAAAAAAAAVISSNLGLVHHPMGFVIWK